MNFTNHHSKHKDEHKDKDKHEYEHVTFKPNCCCHDYPGHFSSVDCNNKKLNTCNFMLGYDRTKYNPNMLYTTGSKGYNNHNNDNKHHTDTKNNNDSSIFYNHHNPVKKTCNCK